MIAKLAARLHKVEEQLRRLKPAPAPGMLTSHTSRGVLRRPKIAAVPADEAVPCLVWKGEYDLGSSYEVNDVVLYYTTPGSAKPCGTYVAVQDVPIGTLPGGATGEDETYWEELAPAWFISILLQDDESAASIMLDPKQAVDSNGTAHQIRMREVEVCVDGEIKHMLVLASEIY